METDQARTIAFQSFLARRGGLLKTCGRCGQSKRIRDNFGLKIKKFYTGRDGTRKERPTPCVEADAYCNTCNSKRRSEYALRAPAEVTARQQTNFQKLLDRKAADASIQANAVKRWREKFPEKAAAHCVANRVHPTAMPCSIEGCTNLGERHHPDYKKPKDIVWLCRKHHKAEHVRLKRCQ